MVYKTDGAHGPEEEWLEEELSAIQNFLDDGGVVLGWRNQFTRKGSFAIGGGVARDIPDNKGGQAAKNVGKKASAKLREFVQDYPMPVQMKQAARTTPSTKVSKVAPEPKAQPPIGASKPFFQTPKVKLITDALARIKSKDKQVWKMVETDSKKTDGVREVFKGDVKKFEIQPIHAAVRRESADIKLVTKESEQETFEAMLIVYNAAYPHTPPRIVTHQSALKDWQRAYERVYNNPVPDNIIQVSDQPSEKKSPSPKP